MKVLCLFANEFPYGTLEPYLETEVNYYNLFDKVCIFSLQLRKDHAKTIRFVPTNAEVIPVFYASRSVYFLYSAVAVFDINFYKDLLKIFSSWKNILSKLITLFVFVSRSHYEYNKVKRHFKKNEENEYVLYSYRFEYQPYVAVLLKKLLKNKITIVSRAHGYDLYENRHPNNYIPLRETILKYVDNVYPCSEYGTQYLKHLYPLYNEKIAARFLGTKDYGLSNYSARNKREVFKIVSCSNVIPIKRLDLIVQALSHIQEYRIIWTHYGDGYLLDSIKQMSKQLLPKNITAEFMGNVDNEELMNSYLRNEYHIFINVSSTEGIPVSIMEANSFGIPCLATNVGGTPELIVSGKNGELLNAGVDPISLSKEITRFYEMPDEEYMQYRKESRKMWNYKFNAEQNYQEFVQELVK